MVRYKVILAYDGTEFLGYQRQGETAPQGAGRTVQGEVEAALRRLGWQGTVILAAGRTDTGVHATGQVIAFDLDWKHSAEKLQAALNAYLPHSVSALDVSETRPDFHPRYDALSRRYRYRIFCQAVRHPLRERYAWRVWPAVDVEQMRQAAQMLVGKHDFAAFGTPPRSGGSTIRWVSQAIWQPDPAGQPAWIFEIEANAFLYHMVRRTVNFLVEIGQGRIPLSRVSESLAPHTGAGSKQMLQGLAPSQGLELVQVTYGSGRRSAEWRENGGEENE